MTTKRFARQELLQFAHSLLASAGLENDKATVVAELLIRTDEMGVTTHGISLIPYYVPEILNGNMASDCDCEVVVDNKVTAVWDGHYLPGHWVMTQALELGMERVEEFGLVAMAIRRSHHIGCLSTLTRIAALRGYVCYIATSDPAGHWVAPFGGVEPLITPNPWAIAYPTSTHPVLIDSCASITTVSKCREHINAGTQFEHPWLMDAHGNATRDPSVMNTEPKGSLLPIGGLDHGHKGFGLGLMIEMLTQAMSGHGRRETPERWGGNVYLQIMDPAAFGGIESFIGQVDYLNEACRQSASRPGCGPVRIPGDRSAASLEDSSIAGISLPDEVLHRLQACAQSLDVPVPMTQR